MTVGTVTRAYQIASRRGLIAGEVGRGTFVQALPGDPVSNVVDLSLNALPPHPFVAELSARLDPSPSSSASTRASLLEYPARCGRDEHRAAGARWIARRGVSVEASQVLVTVGAQHALAIGIMAATSPGDAILVEELTYSGVLAVTRATGLKAVPVAIDAEGLRPESLESACQSSGARVLVIQPTIHNPTGVTMSALRRGEIAGIATRFGLTVIEDDTYGFLLPDTPPIVRELTTPWIYVTSCSKSLAAGYRTGFLASTPHLLERAAQALFATAVAASPISASLAVSLIDDGLADRIVEWKRDEVKARGELARKILPNVPAAVSPFSPHVWLPLPRPWRSATLAAAARTRGLLLGASEPFHAQSGASARAIRICLLPPRTRERLATALESVAELLAGEPAGEMTI